MANKPVKTFRIGALTASVWKNNGSYSTTFQRSWKDGEEWKNGDAFFEADLYVIPELSRRASAWISEQAASS